MFNKGTRVSWKHFTGTVESCNDSPGADGRCLAQVRIDGMLFPGTPELAINLSSAPWTWTLDAAELKEVG